MLETLLNENVIVLQRSPSMQANIYNRS